MPGAPLGRHIPYGMNTTIWVKENDVKKKVNLKKNDAIRITNLEKFYLAFLKNFRIISKKVVIIFPHYVDYRKLCKKAGFKIEKEFSSYIHRSLTRKILVLV